MTMIVIHNIEGEDVQVEEGSILLFAGPYPTDPNPVTYVYTAASRIVTAETGEALIARLGNSGSFAVLTRPNESRVWVNSPTVLGLRDALSTEAPAKSVVLFAQRRQAIMEDIEAARALINARGGRV